MNACIQYMYTGMTAQRQRGLAKGVARFDMYTYTQIHKYTHTHTQYIHYIHTHIQYIHTYIQPVQDMRGRQDLPPQPSNEQVQGAWWIEDIRA